MTIFLWGPNNCNVAEVGPSATGTATFLMVMGSGVWIPPEWARKVAKALNEYADREERGELHPVVGQVDE